MIYGSWNIRCNRHNFLSTIFCHSGMFFALLPPYGPRKSKFWKNEKNTWRNVYHKWQKWKKPSGDIIISHRCIINDNHMMYGSWDTECATDKIFCHFEPFFALLPPPTTQKSKFWKKNNKKTIKKQKNKTGEIIILHMCTINDNDVC